VEPVGAYDVGELNRALFEEAKLFDWRAFILPMDDFAIHGEVFQLRLRVRERRP
jgi:hypothetical protein